MTIFSRRQFLQLAGVALAGSQIDLTRFFQPAPQNVPVTHLGRALAVAPVHRTPNGGIIAHLWPDSVLPIQASKGAWFKLAQGYVLKTALQPMALYDAPAQVEKPTFWAEVAGPVAAIRQWCAADAPLVTRIGHGGVAQVIDLLPAEPISWYGIAAENGDLLGWTQTTRWRRVISESTDISSFSLEIDQQHQNLSVYQNQTAILNAPISIGQTLTPGKYALQRGQMSSTLNGEFHGVPWQIRIGDVYNLNGVYWHNQFGTAAPGPAVQMTPIMARWLYHNLSDNEFVTIV
jgi:hypothetical protein